MEPQAQSEHETWHLILFDRSEPQILLKKTDAGFVLPAVDVPRWERLAENLTIKVKDKWGCDAVCLFSPTNTSEGTADDKHYEVMECWNRSERNGETEWRTIVSLADDSSKDEAGFRVIEACIRELDRYERDPDSPFARKGWIDELRDWIANVIRPLGLEISGSFRQHNAGPTFNLTRFETTASAVWFKAVGEPNRQEFPITLKLADLFPKFLPEVLGTRTEWNGWLSREARGINPGEVKSGALWERAATALAKLQIESISQSNSILATGARDLRFEALLAVIDPFFDLMQRLMDQQTTASPARLNREELSLLKVQVDDALRLFQDFGIPNTLGHLDLNPCNVIASEDECVFLDWAEAYVGHPFFSLEYLLQHFQKTGASTDCQAQILDAYKTPWRQLMSCDSIDEGLRLTPLSAVFAFAVGTEAWKDQDELRDPKIAGYLRSLARRMSREAAQLMERRSRHV